MVVPMIFALGSQMASQSASSSGPAFVHEADTLRIRSRHVVADFEIRVAQPLPAIMSPLPVQYQVLYLLDGDLFFGLATDMTRVMHRLFVELPPILVVGIGYGTNDDRVFSEMRNRDFTPTAIAGIPTQELPTPSGPEPLVPEAQRYGGAGRFLDFLLDEVKPLITARYPLATGRSTLVGSSMGGLFVSYVLLEKPDSFDQYIIASPALWWDDRLLVRTAAQRPLLRGNAPARVFLAVGALEEGAGIPQLDAFRLISNTREFARQLQDRPASPLDVWIHVFDGETHTSVVPTAITRGLRTLYGRGTYVRPLP
jgi:hypothetical protein